MNEYNVNDFQEFSNAETTTTDNIHSLVETLTTIKTEAEKLRNTDLFFGPICESVVAEWDKISGTNDELLSGFSNVIAYLSQTSIAYQTADTKSSNEIGGDTNG